MTKKYVVMDCDPFYTNWWIIAWIVSRFTPKGTLVCNLHTGEYYET